MGGAKMKANELRIGNWIINGIGEEFQTNEHTIAYYDNGIATLGEFKPIPLTEQWLKDFGFTINGCWCSNKLVLESDKTLMGFKRYWFNSNKLREKIRIKYVHQLQNLYFALTGKELIKS